MHIDNVRGVCVCPPGLDVSMRLSPALRHDRIATLFHGTITMQEKEIAMRLIIGLALIVLGLGIMGQWCSV